jgi:hypothetical protein
MRVIAIALAAGTLLPLAATGPRAAPAEAPSESDVKAAMLYNFAKFVEWPAEAFPSADAPFVIAVLGNDPLGPALERLLVGKTVAGRAIRIRRWRKARERGACQMLFVSATEQVELKRLLSDVGQQPVLTVADMPEFAAQGGMIGLVVEDNRLRFEINTDGTERAHLKVSSRLLSLAHIVSPPH